MLALVLAVRVGARWQADVAQRREARGWDAAGAG
eukprot:COSAG02_NODE_57119_length_282_cov_0.633880_1_plen_33_part_01